jgi:hypothetical protein
MDKYENEYYKYIKNFLFWFVVNGIVIGLFELIKFKYGILEKQIAYYLFLGIYLRIFSKFIFSAYKKSTFKFNKIFFWAGIYSLILFLLDFLIKESVKFNIHSYLLLALKVSIFTIIIMFLGGAKIVEGHKSKFLRAPDQIITGIASIAGGILCMRFSKLVFLDWIGWVEGIAWSFFIGWALIIIGFLVIVAWWRNNIMEHTFGIRWGKW